MEWINNLARASRLLVVSDFDGTLADFATDIYAVAPRPQAVDALERLVDLPDTTVAVLSGRHLEGLRRVCPLAGDVVFAGSHGAEASTGNALLSPEMEAHLNRIGAQLEALRATYPHTFIEVKPYQRVFHTVELSQVNPDLSAQALEQAASLPTDGFPDVVVGKNIAEYSAAQITKGTWISSAIKEYAPDAVVFIGDDTTDETAFKVLNEADNPNFIGVKVGAGETLAAQRVADIDAVCELLTALADARSSKR